MGADTAASVRHTGGPLNQTGRQNGELRVLHVMAPARTGGLESVVVELSAGLRRSGHDVQVAVVLAPGTEREHPVVQALIDRGVPVHVLVLGARDYLGERRAIRRLIRRLDVQVLHTHGYRADALLGDLARREGRANVITLHGFVGGSRRGRFYEWVQIQASRYASAVIAVSQPIAERLSSHRISNNVHVIRNAMAPVSDLLSRDAARAALHLPLDMPLVGWVGRLSCEKGPDLFVEALAKTDQKIRGVMLGDGPELSALREQARVLDVRERLFFTGMIPDARRYLHAFDVLALTSRTEGTPMVLLEGMSARVPIVAYGVGGVPDLLGDAAAVCAPGDQYSLVQAIERVIESNSLAQSLANAALQRVSTLFAPEKWINGHIALYDQLIVTRDR